MRFTMGGSILALGGSILACDRWWHGCRRRAYRDSFLKWKDNGSLVNSNN